MKFRIKTTPSGVFHIQRWQLGLWFTVIGGLSEIELEFATVDAARQAIRDWIAEDTARKNFKPEFFEP